MAKIGGTGREETARLWSEAWEADIRHGQRMHDELQRVIDDPNDNRLVMRKDGVLKVRV